VRACFLSRERSEEDDEEAVAVAGSAIFIAYISARAPGGRGLSVGLRFGGGRADRQRSIGTW
jgi:hypothetical protein